MTDICLFGGKGHYYWTDNHENFIKHVKDEHATDPFAIDYLKRQQVKGVKYD